MWRLNTVELVASRKGPSLVVARNCGMGSSSLNADVNAFDKLHMVSGFKLLLLLCETEFVNVPHQVFRDVKVATMNAG